MKACFAALGVCVMMAQGAAKLPPPANFTVDFAKHVQPILKVKCHSCHGSAQQQSGLRLDKRQNALRGGDYGPVIIAGKSAESKLILRLVSGDGGMQMPPTGALAAEEIGILRAWIDQGAEFADIDVDETKERDQPVDPRVAALISAVRARDMERVKKLATAEAVKLGDAKKSTALHHAAGFGDVATIKLLVRKGADVNARNRHGAAPLHWAIGDFEKVRTLVELGADVNGKTSNGRLPLYMAANSRNQAATVRFLLERGAAVDTPDAGGRTALMAAATAGEVDNIKLLLERGAKVNAASGSGTTALIDASRSRNVEAIRVLVERGAEVNGATKRNQTAVAQAAMQGSEDIVRYLVGKGARINVQDERGYTELMYAAYAETMNASLVKFLLDKGADASLGGEGETARSLAAKRGDSEVARMLGVPEATRKLGGVAVVKAASADRPIPAAIDVALAQLEKQSPNFIRRGGCVSCHNQMVPAAAVALANQRGIVSGHPIAELTRAVREVSAERVMEMNTNAVNSLGYELFPLGVANRPGDDFTDAVVHYVKQMQTAQGYWQSMGNRPPLTYDDYITTALAIRMLKTYSPKAEREDSDRRVARAVAWLEGAKPVLNQERVFQLLGLGWGGASAAAIEKSARGLIAAQQADGGWSQLATMKSDAYATGQALYALYTAGKMAPGDAVYQRGVKHLMRTQDTTGIWHVKTRSLPLQPYFESGLPYAQDQWVSAAGTGWAVLALSYAVEPKTVSQR